MTRDSARAACLLGFAGGIMLDIALSDLLPTAVEKNGFAEANM
jgi:zinc transporter ZupT